VLRISAIVLSGTGLKIKRKQAQYIKIIIIKRSSEEVETCDTF